jgi:hypothetical protein
LLATLITIAIALFVIFAFTHPLPSMPLHPLLGGGGEDHPDLVHDPTSATAISIVIIIAAITFAAFAACSTGQEGPI